MAGSQTIRSYESDDGSFYSISINKSNARIYFGGGSDQLSAVRTSNLPSLPSRLSPRIVRCRSLSRPRVKRTFVCCKKNFLEKFLALPMDSRYLIHFNPTPAHPNEVWVVTGFSGEQHRDLGYLASVAFVPDTGLDDGYGSQ